MNLELLALLARAPEPLDIELTGITVAVNGDPPVRNLLGYKPEEQLARSLADYPAQVKINGRVVERNSAPPPDFRLKVTRPVEFNLARSTKRQLDPATGEESPDYLGSNSRAGGVKFYSSVGPDGRELETARYLSPEPGKHGPFIPLTEVRIDPVNRLEPGEMDSIRERSGSQVYIPPGSELEARVRERRLETVQQAREHPGIPQPHHGPVYAYPLTAPGCEGGLHLPCAMAVAGTPVVIECDDPGEYVTAVQAILDSDCGMVPVHPHAARCGSIDVPAPENPVRISGPWFVADDNRTDHPKTITMFARVGDEPQERKFPARIWISVDAVGDVDAKAVPGAMDLEQIENLLTRALAEPNDEQLEQDEMTRREEHTENLARHLAGDSRGAMEREIRRMLQEFDTPVPYPDEPLTVTSLDGRITVTVGGKP